MAQEKAEQIVPEITCQEVVRWASAYLDEHVGGEWKRRIVVHLATCSGCETYMKQIATVRNVVGLLPKAVGAPYNSHRLRQTFVMRIDRSIPRR